MTNGISDDVTILLGNGDGTFASSSVPVGDNPFAVAVGEFNGDGRSDLAVADGISDDVTILLGNRDGTFASSSIPVGLDPFSVAVGQFN